MVSFRCDYEEGACPEVMDRLIETNRVKTPGYGADLYCDSAKELIRRAAQCPEAEIYFTVGGTPTNAMTLAQLMRPYEAAVAADTGHINVHETGAVEACGHKVLTRPNVDGKLTPDALRSVVAEHTDYHMVKPRVAYISQPTEIGTLYSLAELSELRAACDEMGLLLYCDGARLASALTAEGNDVFLPDLARLCDAFYIGGTKCGALFGEALVFPDAKLARGFDFLRKQRGGLLAKGFLLGVQFEALMRDHVYEAVGRHENAMADKLRQGLKAKGHRLLSETHTNQVFPIFSNVEIARLKKDFGFYTSAAVNESESAIRLVTSWATEESDVEAFLAAL